MDKAGIVVAGSDGPAAGAAWALKAAGARLVVLDTDLDRGHRLVLALNTGNSGIAVFLPGDPASSADLAEAVAECRTCWGRCDLVVQAPAGG